MILPQNYIHYLIIGYRYKPRQNAGDDSLNRQNDEILHSLDEGVDDNVLDAWDKELTQRLAEIDAGTANGEPSDKVLLELREKYS